MNAGATPCAIALFGSPAANAAAVPALTKSRRDSIINSPYRIPINLPKQTDYPHTVPDSRIEVNPAKKEGLVPADEPLPFLEIA